MACSSESAGTDDGGSETSGTDTTNATTGAEGTDTTGPATTDTGEDTTDTGTEDTTGEDTTGEDTTGEDTTGEDTTGEDTTDTGGEDTGGEDTTDTDGEDTTDTGGEDTGGEDTGGEDTGGEDTTDTGGEDTGGEDTGGEDTGGEDTGNTGDTGDECALHQECLDGDFCTKDLCVEGQCVSDQATCDDASECTTDSCNPLVGCIALFEGGEGCQATVDAFSATFDDGTLQGMIVADLAGNAEAAAPVVWVPDPVMTFSGAGALYFGTPGIYNYDTGKVVAAAARTPLITLPEGQQAHVRFHAWIDVESGNDWDILTVAVVTASGQVVPVWAKNDDNVTLAQWQTVEADLTAFAGTTIEVEISFNSVDPTFNDTMGVYIDSVEVGSLLVPKGCESEADCDDGIACTEESCSGGSCVYSLGDSCCVTHSDCFDADACTIDICAPEGTCDNVAVANPLCCNLDADCADNNLCTTDKCEANSLCTNIVDLANPICCTTKAHCNDNDSCTIDACSDSICGYINTCCQSDEECNDGDDICTSDSCIGGACKYSYLPVPGCCEPLLMDEGFEAGGDGWTFTGGSGACKWQTTDGGQHKDGDWALYYGNESAKNYDCGQNSGTAVGPEVTIPDKPGLLLEFDFWMATETGSSYDQTTIRIVEGANKQDIFTKTTLGAQTTWNHHSYDLTAYAGKTIQVEIQFNTVDSLFNTTEGVYLDNVQVTDACQ